MAWTNIGATVLSLAMLWLTGCSGEPSRGAGAQGGGGADGGFVTNQNVGAESEVREVELVPQAGKVVSYAGSKECRECHEKEYGSWHQSYHRSMTQLPVPGAVLGDFNGVVLTNQGHRFTLERRADEYWVKIQRLGEAVGGGESEVEELPLGLVTGSHHMQVYWVPNGMGNAQMGFPFTWLIPEKRWVPRNTTFIRPPQMEHRAETWNQVCARCHATGAQPNYDRESRTWGTQMADLGIACEACHGPGEKHVAEQRVLKREGKKPDPKVAMTSIVHPEKLEASRASQVCGFCHSMKWFDRNEGWPLRGFSYRPGDDLEKSTPVIRPKQLEKQPWLTNVLAKNPDILQDFFWGDGMIRVSGREYNGLIESPCYKGGHFSCLSCHSLHGSEPNDQLAREKTGTGACVACHERFRSETEVAKHTHHRVGGSGAECYNCHMPHTTYGVLSAIRSHQISSPRVVDQKATGRPNACNLCHLDKTLLWTSGKLQEWYGHTEVGLSAEEREVADSVRMGLSGDAGQRALVAWHLGWGPGLEVAGREWVGAVLGAMLDDPYAAIRCVAERSLRAVSPGLVPSGYDYTIPVDGRSAVMGGVISAWSRTMGDRAHGGGGGASGILVRAGDEEGTMGRLRELISRRDERVVRLRE